MTDPTEPAVVHALKRLPYPADWPVGAGADADQRDARARAAARTLADNAWWTVLADGYDPADPAVLMRLGSEHGVDAAASVYEGCTCTKHLTNGAMFVAAALALRVAELERRLGVRDGAPR